VTVTLRAEDGQAERVRCDYVVGCDGGSSEVRRNLGSDRRYDQCRFDIKSTRTKSFELVPLALTSKQRAPLYPLSLFAACWPIMLKSLT